MGVDVALYFLLRDFRRFGKRRRIEYLLNGVRL
jgi:hypothetical protein